MRAVFSKSNVVFRAVLAVCVFAFFCGAFIFAQDADATEKNDDAVQSETHLDEDAEEISAIESAVEQFYHDSTNRLRLFSYGEETFVLDSSYNGRSTSVTRDDDRILRRYYDDALRLKKIETWDIKNSVKDAVIVALEKFEYSGDSITPSTSTSISSTNYSTKTYNESGKPSVIRLFKIVGDDEKQNEKNVMEVQKRERILESISSWKYSSDGKMIEASYQKMEDDGKSVAFSSKEIYSYKNNEDDDVPPDYEFYEDEKLRTKIIYENADDYEVSYFFDGGFVVTETFKDGQKISDIVMQEGSFVRGQNYDR